MELEENIRRIKLAATWFPGLLLGLERHTGKTKAVLEMLRERHDGEAIYFCPSELLAKAAARRYGEMYPARQAPYFFWDIEAVRGLGSPIYVDEWWRLDTRQQRGLMEAGRVVLRIGTE